VNAMAKPNLRIATAARSPEREQLAAMIERHVVAVRQLAANEAAQESTETAISDARVAVEKAAEAIEAAKANAATHLTAVAMGTAGAAPLSVSTCRAKAQDAEDALEATLAARAALDEQHKAAESELQYARAALDGRIRDVCRSEVAAARLLKQAEVLQADLVARRLVLKYLLHSDLVAEPEMQAVTSFLRSNSLPGTYGTVEFTSWDAHPAPEPFRAWCQALTLDADSPVPLPT
jgi:hypothetical protein